MDEADGGRNGIQGFGSWVAGRRPIELRGDGGTETLDTEPRNLKELLRGKLPFQLCRGERRV